MEGAACLTSNSFCLILRFFGLLIAFLSEPIQGQIPEVTLTDGFSISYYSVSVYGARSICLSRGNHDGKTIVYVSTRGSIVYAVIDDNGDNQPDRTFAVINNRNVPNGIAWRNGSLFVAEVTTVWRYDNVDTYALAGNLFPAPTLVKGDLPREFEHSWRYIAFGPDDKLYITIGAPCNVCDREGFGIITRMNPDGSGYETFAKGIRNSVGLAWHPDTKELWATDNNRDWMGDNQPDCRLLRAPTKGIDFGFPYCHCNGTGPPELRNPMPGYPIPDDGFNPGELQRNCSNYPVCTGAIGPHVAPLGLRFYTGKLFPSARFNRRTMIIAEHGSWNRAQRIGYRVSAFQVDEQGKVASHEILASFLLPNNIGWGRPVDVEVLPDGSLLVSDDQRGVLYRITYERQFQEVSLSYGPRGFGGAPAKPAISVGSDFMVAITRSEFSRAIYQVYTKQPWLPVKQSFLTQFHRSGTPCRVGPFPGSGFTAYDSMADRWLIMEVARNATSNTYYLCLLLSLSGVPYGLLYRGYSFALAGDPGDVVLGVMPDAYYVATGENPPAVYALNRATLLAGSVPTAERRTATVLSGFQRQGVVPAHAHGTPRNATSCGYFARHVDDELHTGSSPWPADPSMDYVEVWYFCPSFATGGPQWGSVRVAVADFDSLLCSGNSDVPCFAQPGSAVQLVPYHEGVNPPLGFRSFAGYDALLMAFTVNVGNNRGGIKWVELRRTATSSPASWFVYQEGTYSPDAKSRWLGSAAMDSAGNIALGYAAVDASNGVLPGLYFTGRVASDPLGTMTKGETQLVGSGKASSTSLFGGRSMVVLDGRDGCSFYFDGPWENGTLRSPTYLGVFRFPNCGVCSINTDCDDGLYCTEDKCRDGVCVAALDPLLCRFGEYCDEAMDACVACLNNSHCSNGAFCDGEEPCVDGVCQPAVAPACAAGQYCLEDQDRCVDCLLNSNCDDGNLCNGAETCVNGTCQAGTPPVCLLSRRCQPSTGICVDCLANRDCNDYVYCNGVEVCTGSFTCAPGAAPCTSMQLCVEEQQECVDKGGGIQTPLMSLRNTTSSTIPAYPSLAFGVDYLVQVQASTQAAANSTGSAIYLVFDLFTGNKLRQLQLASHHTGDCAASPAGRGYVIYDHLVNRWVMAELALSGTRLCVLFSNDSSPLGTWTAYSFPLPSAADSFSMGLAPDGYYIGTMEVVPRVYALDSAAMLANATVALRALAVPALPGFSGSLQGLVPVTLVGKVGVGRPGPCGLFLRLRDDEVHAPLLLEPVDPSHDYVEVWRLCPAFADAGLASVRQVDDVAVAELDMDLCGNGPCFRQQGAGSPLLLPYARGTLHPVAMYRAFSSHESILTSVTVDASGADQGAVHWVEMRLPPSSSWDWITYQEGSLVPNSKNRFLGAVAMDNSGNVLLGYSVTDSSMYPSLAYSGRMKADTLGTMAQGEFMLVAGGARSSQSAFGGQSAAAVDAHFGCVLALLGSHGDMAGGASVSTSIALLRYDSCVDWGSSQLCSADATCSDGEYCSGVETCRASGTCAPGEDPCAIWGTSCAPQSMDCAPFECTVDMDCDNGAFCDGMERCVGDRCYPAEVGPCPATTVCVEASRACTPRMQVGTRVASNGWTTVTFASTYTSPILVASLRDSGNNPGAMVLRVRNVTSASFQARVQAVDGSLAADEVFDFIVMEEGTYDPSHTGGLRMEARKYASSRVDGSAPVLGYVGEQHTLWGTFASPVVVGQVMSANDDWSVFYSYVPTSSVVTTGRHIGARACASAAACHIPETIGFIVFEATLTSQSNAYGDQVEAFITGRTVGGSADGSPFLFPFRASFTSVPPSVGIVSVTLYSTDNVTNPGWARMYGPRTTQTNMRLFLEDDQSRSRVAAGLGRVSYLAFQ